MNIVVNSTPLISLAIINQLELLQKLFNNVIIPSSVYNEVVLHGEDKAGFSAISAGLVSYHECCKYWNEAEYNDRVR